MAGTHTSFGGMNDGRAFTNYGPMCAINTQIMRVASVKSWDSHSYKEYLMKNGLQSIQAMSGMCGPHACADLGEGVKTAPPPQQWNSEPFPSSDVSPYAPNL